MLDIITLGAYAVIMSNQYSLVALYIFDNAELTSDVFLANSVLHFCDYSTLIKKVSQSFFFLGSEVAFY